jgi:hypothetical protein
VSIKKTLSSLLREIITEAENNPGFRTRLEEVLGPDTPAVSKTKQSSSEGGVPYHQRPSNRRAPAKLDPVHLAREGNTELRDALSKLDLEQLRDVVADYGMDPGKLVLKWRDKERVIERIIEVSHSRAQKGSAFHPPSEPIQNSGSPEDKNVKDQS